MRFMIVTTIAVAMLAIVPASAATTLVTFSAASCVGGCVNGTAIDQGFGDTAGVDMSHRSLSEAGNAGVVNGSSLRYWSANYSGSSAAYAAGGSTAVGEIRFDVLTSGLFKLNSVDFGGWLDEIQNIEYRVFELDYTLITSGVLDTAPLALTTINFGQSSTSGLIFQFGPDGFNGGVQNVSYSFESSNPIPEPASWAMMIAGFGLVGATMRRRRGALA